MIKKLLSDSAIYGLAPYIPKIVSIFILPLLTAHLTEVDYGIAGTIAAYTAALAAFSTLGFNAVLQISFFKSRCQYKILWREIYGFLQFWMVIFAVLQGAILYWIMPMEALDNRWNIILLTNFNGVFFGPSALLGPLYYQLNQRPMPIAIRSVLSGFITLLSNYILIVIYDLGYMGWYVSSFVGTFLVNASYWYILNFKLGLSPIYKFKARTIKNNLKVSLPVIPHYYSIFLINTSNRLIMDRCRLGMSAIGEFNMAQQITTYIDSGVSAINTAINPMCMNAIRDNNEKEARRIIYSFSLLTLSVTFLFALWSREIFELLISNEVLAGTYPYAAMLVMALNYRPMYVAVSNIFFYHEKTLALLYITFAAGLIALVANLIFIPFYGIWAAVIVNYVAFLYMGYSGFFFPLFKENSQVSYHPLAAFSIQIALTLLCVFFLDSGFVTKIIITSIYAFGALLFFLKKILHRNI